MITLLLVLLGMRNEANDGTLASFYSILNRKALFW